MGFWQRLRGERRRERSHEPRKQEPSGNEVTHPPAVPRAVVRRPARTETLGSASDAPPVVIACEQCGFEYSVTSIDGGRGHGGVLWECACGIRYIPPGGKDSYSLVKP